MTDYRVLVTGSRTWTDVDRLERALDVELDLSRTDGLRLVVVHGACADGADAQAHRWAVRNGVSIESHPAVWRPNGIYNPQAGLLRNRQMVDRGANACLAFIRCGSRGATHCADLAEEAGIPVLRHTDNTPPAPKWRAPLIGL